MDPRQALHLDLDGSPDQLAPLDPLLDGKRIAFLGEANHWVHEKYAYRLLFIRWLHSRGFGVLGEELSRTDGKHVARHLESGDPHELETIVAYGYRGFARADRDDSPTGVLKGLENPDHAPPFAAEQRRFAAGLRSLRPLRFFGFDVEYEPQGCYAELPPRLAPVPGETLDDEIDRVGRCLAELVTSGADPEVVRDVRSLWHGLQYVRMAHPAPTYEALNPAMAFRERAMHEHVDHVLGTMLPRERLILLGHDQHLAKNDRELRTPGGGAGPGGGEMPSLGTYLSDKTPDEMFAVWMLEDRGAHARPLPHHPDARIRSVAGTLNARLAKVGECFAIPTSAIPGEVDIVSMYGSRIRTDISAQADVVFFVREVSPLRT